MKRLDPGSGTVPEVSISEYKLRRWRWMMVVSVVDGFVDEESMRKEGTERGGRDEEREP